MILTERKYKMILTERKGVVYGICHECKGNRFTVGKILKEQRGQSQIQTCVDCGIGYDIHVDMEGDIVEVKYVFPSPEYSKPTIVVTRFELIDMEQ